MSKMPVLPWPKYLFVGGVKVFVWSFPVQLLTVNEVTLRLHSEEYLQKILVQSKLIKPNLFLKNKNKNTHTVKNF